MERTLLIAHPDPSKPPLAARALVVWNPGKARLDAQLRETQLRQLERELTQLTGTLGRRPYTTAAAVHKRLATLRNGHPARHFLTVALTGGPGTDQPLRLRWARDGAALAQVAALDSRYVLGTNDPRPDAAQMLEQSKRRDVPEKRFALAKGPLAERPVYVHKDGRILGLVFCAMVALLLFALLELLLRRAGLPLSGRQFLAACAPLSLVVLYLHDGTTLRHVSGLAPPVETLLQAMGWPAAAAYAQPARKA